MADWLIDRPTDPRAFPTVRHRHANGTVDAVRDRTPTTIQELGDPPLQRWTYQCPCGEVWTMERRR
jgi:hypothetical protein